MKNVHDMTQNSLFQSAFTDIPTEFVEIFHNYSRLSTPFFAHISLDP